MNNINFHIYGVPDGFDIYQLSPNKEEKNYFLCFYDEYVKETTKFVVHQRADGCITYSYLRYHLFSNGSRPNSFIGLSVVFERSYYADVVSLYSLLEEAFKKLVDKGVILKRLGNGQNVQFATSQFCNQVDEVNVIRTFVLGNLQSPSYAADIKPLGNNFAKANNDAAARVPYKDVTTEEGEAQLNQFVLTAMGKYKWVYVSPSYAPINIKSMSGNRKSVVFETELSVTVKKELEDNLQPLTARTLDLAMLEMLTSADIQAIAELQTTVQKSLQILNKYAKKQPELQQMRDGYSSLDTRLTQLLAKNPVPDPPGPNPKTGLIEKLRPYLMPAGCVAVIALLVCSYFFLFSDESGDSSNVLPPCDPRKELTAKVDSIANKAKTYFANQEFINFASTYAELCDTTYNEVGKTHKDTLQKLCTKRYDELLTKNTQESIKDAYDLYCWLEDGKIDFLKLIDLSVLKNRVLQIVKKNNVNDEFVNWAKTCGLLASAWEPRKVPTPNPGGQTVEPGGTAAQEIEYSFILRDKDDKDLAHYEKNITEIEIDREKVYHLSVVSNTKGLSLNTNHIPKNWRFEPILQNANTWLIRCTYSERASINNQESQMIIMCTQSKLTIKCKQK